MSSAYFPQIEGDDNHSAATAIDGKALSKRSKELDAIAAKAGVTPLSEFVSVHTDDYGLFEDAGLSVPDPKWFPAADGLATVRALRDACRAAGDKDAALFADFDALEKVLMEADAQKRRWSLGVDM